MKTLIGYHVCHEQFAPSELLRWTVQAEAAGFDCLFSSDHFHPWSEIHGQSGFSWAWMGAALQATRMPGRLICCPGFRYHPAVVAQGVATLNEMFEDRFWLAIGSGEALNESITGEPWPSKDLRNARLRECADVMRALWAGETVTHRGLVVVEEARLYTRPRQPPLLMGAAITETTAAWLGSWADGLVTTSRPPADLRRIIAAFRRGGGEGKPVFLNVGLSYAGTDERARQFAHEQWRGVAFANDVLADLRRPAQFDAMGVRVRPEDMDSVIRISSDPGQHAEWLAADLACGVEELWLHNIGPNQAEFIDVFGDRVLPQLR